jgi:nucleotide-binding universal stress UspA family protein
LQANRIEEASVSTILIGVDATARSEDAVALARRLTQVGPADIVVAAIVEPGAPAHGPAREAAHDAARRMSGLLIGIEPERIRTAVVASRSPAQGLHELAEAESASLIVVGSTHTGHLGRVRPGSTGERLLYGAPCAVAVAPHSYRAHREPSFARIGVAYDGFRESRDALVTATTAARALGAKLEIVTVLVPDIAGPVGLVSGAAYERVRDEVEANARRDLDEKVANLAGAIPAEGVVLEGRPWRRLADHSANLDLLFIGSRGYGPLRAVIAGGTSGPVLHHAQCPVVVLPRGVEQPLDQLFSAGSATAPH